MDIGIIGSGNVGKALGEVWLKQGHDVLFSYSRDLQKLRAYAASLGANACAGTPAEAVGFAGVGLFAPPWPAVEDALQAAGPLTGKILIDCTNPLNPDVTGLAVGHTTSGAEEIAAMAPGGKVVKAFNTAFAQVYQEENRLFGSRRVTMFYCGDDAEAKSVVSKLICDVGFDPVDCGPLTAARYLEPVAMLVISLGYGQGRGTNFAVSLIGR